MVCRGVMSRPLNQQQEDFCLNIVEGKTGMQSAIEARYAFRSARVTASRLLTRANIIARIAELRQRAEDASVATVIERKQVLSEILRGRVVQFVDKDGNVTILDSAALQEVRIVHFGKDDDVGTTTTVKLNDPVKAIAELNKMEGIHGRIDLLVDNRTLNITVASPEGAEMVKRIAAGEGTGKEKEA